MSRRIKISGAQWNEKNVPQSVSTPLCLSEWLHWGAKVTCSQLQVGVGERSHLFKDDLVRQGDGLKPVYPADKATSSCPEAVVSPGEKGSISRKQQAMVVEKESQSEFPYQTRICRESR